MYDISSRLAQALKKRGKNCGGLVAFNSFEQDVIAKPKRLSRDVLIGFLPTQFGIESFFIVARTVDVPRSLLRLRILVLHRSNVHMPLLFHFWTLCIHAESHPSYVRILPLALVKGYPCGNEKFDGHLKQNVRQCVQQRAFREVVREQFFKGHSRICLFVILSLR